MTSAFFTFVQSLTSTPCISVEKRAKTTYIASHRLVNNALLIMFNESLLRGICHKLPHYRSLCNKLMLDEFFLFCFMIESHTVLLQTKEYILRLTWSIVDSNLWITVVSRFCVSGWSFQKGRDWPLRLNAYSGYARPLGVWSQPLVLLLVFLPVDCPVQTQKRVTNKNTLIS